MDHALSLTQPARYSRRQPAHALPDRPSPGYHTCSEDRDGLPSACHSACLLLHPANSLRHPPVPLDYALYSRGNALSLGATLGPSRRHDQRSALHPRAFCVNVLHANNIALSTHYASCTDTWASCSSRHQLFPILHEPF